MQRRLNHEEPTYQSLKTVQLRGFTSEFYEKLRAIWEGQKDNGEAYITEDALVESAEYRARRKNDEATVSRKRPEGNVGGRDTSNGVDRLDDESTQERLSATPMDQESDQGQLTITFPLRKKPQEKVALEGALRKLAGSETLEVALAEEFDTTLAKQMRSMMRSCEFSGDLGNSLHDYLIDALRNDSTIVWSGLIDSCNEDWPEDIFEYFGIFYVKAMEEDRVGYFFSKEDALSYVYSAGWDVRENSAA